jgi:hypothetical protein
MERRGRRPRIHTEPLVLTPVARGERGVGRPFQDRQNPRCATPRHRGHWCTISERPWLEQRRPRASARRPEHLEPARCALEDRLLAGSHDDAQRRHQAGVDVQCLDREVVAPQDHHPLQVFGAGLGWLLALQERRQVPPTQGRLPAHELRTTLPLTIPLPSSGAPSVYRASVWQLLQASGEAAASVTEGACTPAHPSEGHRLWDLRASRRRKCGQPDGTAAVRRCHGSCRNRSEDCSTARHHVAAGWSNPHRH